MKVELTQDWCMNMAKIEECADDAATMCVWCEERVCGACKSHYDTLTCTHRVFVPTAEQWDAAVEARAAELHEGCRMPMEQARELAASEAIPDWYARGQDWGLADALTNGQSDDWVLDDIARAFAAGAQAGGALESKRTHEIECRRVALEEQADLTAIHLARMQSALEQTATRSTDHLRKAIKAEAKCEVLEMNLEAARRELAKVNNEFGSENADWPEAWRRVAEVKERAGRLWRDNETLRAALTVVVRDWTEQFERNGHLAPQWVKQAREALGTNVRGNRTL